MKRSTATVRSVAALLVLTMVSATAATAGAAPVRILVTPFGEFGEGAKREWVGKAIHQSLVAELSRMGADVEPITPPSDATPPADVDAAIKVAGDAGADIVVFGSYQFAGDELRVTGQTVDVKDAKVIGGIKATGSLRDLFGIEDIIGAQVKRDLRALLPPSTQPSQAQSPGAREPLGGGQQEVVEPTGPVSRPPGGRFAGSDLERSLYDRVRYDPPVAPPPSYYPPHGYGPYYGGGYGGYYYPYRFRPIIIRPGGNVRPPPIGQPRPLPPNGNSIRPREGNTMQSGPGNSIRGGSGNSMQSGPQDR